MEIERLLAEIRAFVTDPGSGRFDELARRVHALQVERIPGTGTLLDRSPTRGRAPRSWREIPPVPVQAFKTMRLALAPASEIFRSSGTLGVRSEHHHPFPDLYRHVLDVSFPKWCPLPDDSPMLALVPPRDIAPDSSLSFMADHVLRTRGGATSGWAWTASGLDIAAASHWVLQHAAASHPVLVFATAFALADWLEDAEGLPPLPSGSVVLETGGFKGRRRELSRTDLLELIHDGLGVPPERVLREYGMCELTSQLYSRSLLGGDPELLEGPPWTRVRLLDPRTLLEAPPGEVGLVGIVDLANLGSAVHVLTQDLGRLESGGLRLLGRASGAELRGCSLAVEEARADV